MRSMRELEQAAQAPLAEPYARLMATGRGKHVGPFSYYHMALVSTLPGLPDRLAQARTDLGLAAGDFNVIKLDAGERLSFLRYEDFDEAPFPALLIAESCRVRQRKVLFTDYTNRANPPILHRKELLFPADHPIVSSAASLTQRLDRRGAFRPSTTIGTRSGWETRLAELRLDTAGRPLR